MAAIKEYKLMYINLQIQFYIKFSNLTMTNKQNSFLNRFAGKTNRITKQGLDSLFLKSQTIQIKPNLSLLKQEEQSHLHKPYSKLKHTQLSQSNTSKVSFLYKDQKYIPQQYDQSDRKQHLPQLPQNYIKQFSMKKINSPSLSNLNKPQQKQNYHHNYKNELKQNSYSKKLFEKDERYWNMITDESNYQDEIKEECMNRKYGIRSYDRLNESRKKDVNGLRFTEQQMKHRQLCSYLQKQLIRKY